MNILIASATSLEIKPLLKHFEFKREINSRLSLMKYKHFNIYVLITGVGMVNTAYWLGCTLSKFQFDLAINLGIAGSYDKSVVSCEKSTHPGRRHWRSYRQGYSAEPTRRAL